MKSSVSKKAPLDFGWIILSVLFQSGAALFAKMAALHTAATGLEGLWGIIYNPYYVCEIVALGLQFVCWAQALKKYPLSFAYPFMSVVTFINLIWSAAIFDEVVQLKHIMGIAIISVGVGCILWNKDT